VHLVRKGATATAKPHTGGTVRPSWGVLRLGYCPHEWLGCLFGGLIRLGGPLSRGSRGIVEMARSRERLQSLSKFLAPIPRRKLSRCPSTRVLAEPVTKGLPRLR
jgi:hypothetical protein